MFPLNTHVRILRGGLDDFPQVKLAGVPGRVCSLHANAAPGMVSVWVDWEQTAYKDIDDLPRVINNFPADLEVVDAESPKFQPRHLKPVRTAFTASAPQKQEETGSNSGDEPLPPASGGLRLV